MFLFTPENRPSHAPFLDVLSSIEGLSISVDRGSPGDFADAARIPLWLELHREGMTFDCSGLAPGPAEVLPAVSDWLGIPVEDRAERLRCVGLALGPHLRAGQASPPILRGLFALASQIAAGLDQCRGVCWAASGTVIGRNGFVELVCRWQSGGNFPAQLVTSLKAGLAGGIETRGLSYFTGQELRIEPASFNEEGQGSLLALRLASQLIYRGTLDAPEQAIAPDGTPLRLEPSANGRFVRVWAG